MKTNRVPLLVLCLLVSSILIAACSEEKTEGGQSTEIPTPPLTTSPITAANAAQIALIKTLEGHNEQAYSVSFSPDGSLLASGGGYPDHTVRLWDARTGESIRVIEAHDHLIWSIGFSPDGNTMATASEDGTLRLWDVSSGERLAELERLDWAVYGAAFTPDGKTLVSADGYHDVKLWDVASRERTGTLEGHQQFVQCLAISPDGSLLATGSGDTTVRLWNLATRESMGILGDHGGVVNAVAFSPDGIWVASAALGGEVTLWNVQTGESRVVIRAGGFIPPAMLSVAFSPDGSVLAFGSMDGMIRLWGVATGEILAQIEAHTDEVTGLAFSPDGTLLASASLDGTVRLWGIGEGTALGASPTTTATESPAEPTPTPAALYEVSSANPETMMIRSFPAGLEVRVVPRATYEGPMGDMYMVTDDYLVGLTPIQTEVEPGDYYVLVQLPAELAGDFWNDGETGTIFTLSDDGSMLPSGKSYLVTKREGHQANVSALFWFKDVSLDEFVTSLPDEELFRITDQSFFEGRFEEYAVPADDWPNLLLMWQRTGKLVWYSPDASRSLLISTVEPDQVTVVSEQASEPGPTPIPTSPAATPVPQAVVVLTPTPLPGDCPVNSEMVISGTGNSGLNVRTEPSFSAAPAFLASEGERVQIIGGPQTSDGLTWCHVRRVQDGQTGWAVPNYLAEAPAEAVPPSPTLSSGSNEDTLTIRSFPPGLEVYVVPSAEAVGSAGESYMTHPDYLVGTTPLEIELEPGDYWVTVSKMDDPIDFRADGETNTIVRAYVSEQGQITGTITAAKSYLITIMPGHQTIVTALFWPKDQTLADFVATLPEETLFPVIDTQFLAETFAVHGIPTEAQPLLQSMLSRTGKLAWYSPDGTQHLYIYFSEPDQVLVDPHIPIPSDSTSNIQPLQTTSAVAEASTIDDQVNVALSAPVEFYISDGSLGPWQFTPEQLGEMLVIEQVAQPGDTSSDLGSVNLDQFRLFLEGLAADLALSPVNTRFTFNEDTRQLEVMGHGVNGRVLDVESTLAQLEVALFATNAADRRVQLIFQNMLPAINDQATASSLGITELIVQRTTYYDDTHRAHMQVVAESFHGLVIPPNEEFSFNAWLGDAGAEPGNEQGMIIIGNQMITSVDSSACQVATTAFQAAFYGGYPILERVEHAYRVSFYEESEGPGMDAAVYAPVADFRFLNDTPYHLLIEVEINPGDRSITWKFYSTSMNRRVAKEGPVIRNETSPPPPIYRPNPDLSAEEIRQVSEAVNGADVYVYRTVYEGDRVIIDREEYHSHYIPWADQFEVAPGDSRINR